MSQKENYLKQAREVLLLEAECVKRQAELIGEDFVTAVEMIIHCQGRVVVTGMGKSGLVGRKIAATLASTGTPSFFLHPGEGVHGDLGMVTSADIVIAISQSGEVDEVLAILPTLKIIGVPIIAITGSENSSLAENSDLVLLVEVEREACTLGLAPTASTTATLALGDALAVVLLNARNFSADDFALFHPGGTLGRRLLLTVEKLMHSGEENPVISQENVIRDALIVMTSKGNHGAAVVVNEKGILTGIVTDGDLRRMLQKNTDTTSFTAEMIMSVSPKAIDYDEMAINAFNLMEKNKITQLLVTKEGKYVGMIHLHDLLREGIV